MKNFVLVVVNGDPAMDTGRQVETDTNLRLEILNPL